MTTTNTAANYITDWNAIHHMRFERAEFTEMLNAPEPEVKPDTSIDICRLAKRGGKWVEIPVAHAPTLASARAYANRGLYVSKIVKDEDGEVIDKQYKAGKLFVRFRGTVPEKPERKPLRPMTKDETNAAINRNRAWLGLAPLSFA